MIFWEEASLNDREKIFEFLYDFNPAAAENSDELIEAKVENLLEQPLMGVQRDGIRGRLLIIPEISMIVSYWVDGSKIRIMRVLHQKQKFQTFDLLLIGNQRSPKGMVTHNTKLKHNNCNDRGSLGLETLRVDSPS